MCSARPLPFGDKIHTCKSGHIHIAHIREYIGVDVQLNALGIEERYNAQTFTIVLTFAAEI